MGEEVKVKLYGVWSSPYSRRIELALKLKGIPYGYEEEDLSRKSDKLLKYNPVHKKIPVLAHNGKPIAESLVILEYIDETWNHHPILLPQDPFEKAQARFWAKFIDEKLLPSVWKYFLSSEEERGKTKEEVSELLRTLQTKLSEKKPFFGGDSIGYLDIVANVVAFWIERVQEVVGIELLDQETFPILHLWIKKLHQISIFGECLPPKEKHLTDIRARYTNAITKD